MKYNEYCASAEGMQLVAQVTERPGELNLTVRSTSLVQRSVTGTLSPEQVEGLRAFCEQILCGVPPRPFFASCPVCAARFAAVTPDTLTQSCTCDLSGLAITVTATRPDLCAEGEHLVKVLEARSLAHAAIVSDLVEEIRRLRVPG